MYSTFGRQGLTFISQKQPTFPAKFEVHISYEPAAQFGGTDGYSRVVRDGCKIDKIENIWSGRILYKSEQQLGPMRAAATFHVGDVSLNGAVLTIKGEIDQLSRIAEILSIPIDVLPGLFNLIFPDSVSITEVKGTIGSEHFYVGYPSLLEGLNVTTDEIQHDKANRVIQMIQWLGARSSPRLESAIRYFRLACRLQDAGQTDWEFMDVVVLNYAKTLQVLFGDQRDSVRDGLKRCGYSEEEIEQDFMPIMALRDKWDVAHVSLDPKAPDEDMKDIHMYLLLARNGLRSLLYRILYRETNGEKLVPDSTIEMPSKPSSDVEKLMKNIRASYDRRSAKFRIPDGQKTE